MSVASLQERARRALHYKFARPANLYLSSTATDGRLLNVRRALKQGMTGDLAGTNLSYVETIDMTEKLIFWRAELVEPLPRNALVIFSPEEAYWLDTIHPIYDQTVSADVVRAREKDYAGKALPGV